MRAIKPSLSKTHLLIPALFLTAAACTADRTMEEVTATLIGPNGGTARSADGIAALVIAPGALSESTEITIATERGRLAPRLASLVYDFGPDGLEFKGNAQLSIGGGSEGSRLANLDGASPVIVPDSGYDPATATVVGTLAHFSSYAAITAYVPCAGLACGAACTICDPADLTCVEPLPTKACNFAGQCVPALPAASLLCNGVPPDAGVIVDAGQNTPDASAPDAGQPADSGVPSGVIAEVEPNNTSGTAQALPASSPAGLFSATVSAAIDPAGDQDWFSFQVQPGQLMHLYARTYSTLGDPTSCTQATDTVLQLVGNGALIAQNDDISGQVPCSLIDTSSNPQGALGPGTYLVMVRHFAQTNTIPQYYLDLSLSPAGNTFPDAGTGAGDAGTAVDAGGGGFFDGGNGAGDAGLWPDAGTGTGNVIMEVEPNDNLGQANLLGVVTGTVAVTATVQGAIGPGGDVDYFRFDLAVPRTLHAITYTQLGNTSVCMGADTVLTLYGLNGVLIAENDDNGTPCSEIQSGGGGIALSAGTHFLRVRHFGPAGAIGNYYLDVSVY